MNELFSLDLAQASQGLKHRAFSAHDLTLACLNRLKSTEPKIAACLTVLEEEALKQATALDQAGYDPSRPLWGLPLTIKDVFCLKGAPTTAGSKQLAHYHSAFEATVVTRLRAAGAIFLAKTNCDEFAMGSSTEFSAFGPTHNPYNLDRVPGGSSGGAAASVAARQAPGAFGTDTGGSIRQPAGLCGCVGLKPTYGRVSRYGIVAYASSFDQAGPLARTVADCGRLLAAVAGPDDRDSTVSRAPLGDYLNLEPVNPKDLVLGLPREFWTADLAPPVRDVLEEAKNLLTKAGVKFVEIDLPSLKFAVATYYVLATAEASSNLARYDGVRYGFRKSEARDLLEVYAKTRQTGLGAEARRRVLLGTFALSSGYYEAYFRKAAQVRRLIAVDVQKALESCHYIFAPVSSLSAWPLGSFLDDPLTIYQMDLMTIPLNLYGGPGLSLPAGLGSDKLPVGAQLWGRPLDEVGLLAAGSLLEKIWPPLAPPPLEDFS
ncbi:MAG: Asp-tRNA(Asn)/Glu-tRNA(Gln) amidotransferase subunit GatA [Deltaproteobacteria bacterium]|nr:Asp-tRNA(Asn)/Glu-tRNA(Gln) amidotransferase subunit GatA [Deltaproteobacteria bacterium]